MERERLRKVFEQGLDAVVGHVLPVAPWPEAGTQRWQSGRWFLRGERCYLIPDDSALGYRLPLDSQPWAAPQDLPWVHPPDPTQYFAPLPSHERLRFAHPVAAPAAGAAVPAPPASSAPQRFEDLKSGV